MKATTGLMYNLNILTQDQLRFVAEHFSSVMIGQSGVNISKLIELKSHNPGLLIFGYIGSRNVIPNSIRYKECESDESLFAHGVNGDRIKSFSFDQFLMDVYNPDWLNKIVQWANTLNPVYDGIFLDVADPTLADNYYTQLPANYNENTYPVAMMELFSTVRQGYSGLVIFNGLVKGIQCDGYVDDVNGGLIEGFIFRPNMQDVNLGVIKGGVDALINAGKKGLLASAATKSDKDNIRKRMFSIGCYFIGWNSNTRYNFIDVDTEFSELLHYYAEYQINLGKPIDNYDKVEDYLDQETNLTIRDFEKGKVIINPWLNNIGITLDGDYAKVLPSGDCVVNSDGSCNSHIEYIDVNGYVVVEKESALILIDRTAPASPTGLTITLGTNG